MLNSIWPCSAARCTYASALPLLVPGILANDPNDTFAPDDLAVPADLLHRCLYSHRPLRRGRDSNDPAFLFCTQNRVPQRPIHLRLLDLFVLLRPEYDSPTGQIVRCQFHGHFVARKNTDVMHAHLSRYVPQDDVPVLELYPECRVRQGLNDLSLHLNGLFLRHYRVGNIPLPLKLAFFSRLSYWCDITYACTWDMKSIVTTTTINKLVPPK